MLRKSSAVIRLRSTVRCLSSLFPTNLCHSVVPLTKHADALNHRLRCLTLPKHPSSTSPFPLLSPSPLFFLQWKSAGVCTRDLCALMRFQYWTNNKNLWTSSFWSPLALMDNVTPFFTAASNRICSWPLALAECIQGGFCVLGNLSRVEKGRGMSWYQGEGILR